MNNIDRMYILNVYIYIYTFGTLINLFPSIDWQMNATAQSLALAQSAVEQQI